MTNLLGLASRPSDGADPRRTQKRVAVSPSGRQVAIDITGDDRLNAINRLPGRWKDVVKARERGETLDQISRWAKVPPACHPACRLVNVKIVADDPDSPAEQVHDGPPCLRYLLSWIYNQLESELHDLAARRARLLP